MENNESYLDPVFKVPSCKGRDGGGITSGANSPEYQRANGIHRRGAALRDAVFSKQEKSQRGGSPPARLLQKEISRRGFDYSAIITSVSKLPSSASDLRRVLPLISEDELRDSFDGPDSLLEYCDKGSEATVFIDQQNDFVYKLTPVDANILDIPFIRNS